MKTSLDVLMDRLQAAYPNRSCHISFKVLSVPCLGEIGRSKYWSISVIGEGKEKDVLIEFNNLTALIAYIDGLNSNDIGLRFKALIAGETDE